MADEPLDKLGPFLRGSKKEKTSAATAAWMWRVLGILVGTGTLISLIKTGLVIELSGVPAKLYQHYVWLREMLFEPLLWVLRRFGLTIPVWSKDVVMAYGLVAAAHWRPFRGGPSLINNISAAFGVKGARGYPATGLAFAAIYAALWPAVHVALGLRTVFAPNPGRSLVNSMVYEGVRRPILMALVEIIVCVVAFFLWSYLSNVYGPGG